MGEGLDVKEPSIMSHCNKRQACISAFLYEMYKCLFQGFLDVSMSEVNRCDYEYW